MLAGHGKNRVDIVVVVGCTAGLDTAQLKLAVLLPQIVIHFLRGGAGLGIGQFLGNGRLGRFRLRIHRLLSSCLAELHRLGKAPGRDGQRGAAGRIIRIGGHAQRIADPVLVEGAVHDGNPGGIPADGGTDGGGDVQAELTAIDRYIE